MAKEVVIGIITSVIVLVIGGLIAFFIQKPVQDVMERPEVIAIDQYNEKVCPEIISFRTLEELAPFSIKFQNTGADGLIYMKISSDQIKSRVSDVDEFKEENFKDSFVSSKGFKDFRFELKPKDALSSINDFVISFAYGCEEIGCKEKKFCCKYQRKAGAGFKLVSQTC